MQTTPSPDAQHARLMRFVGRWSGPEVLSPSPFGRGGPAIGHTTFRTLDGLVLIQDYEEEQHGSVIFRGHGVFMIEPGKNTVLWWWFDSVSPPPDGPMRGYWEGDRLLFHTATPLGESRYLYELSGDRYRGLIENRLVGQTEFVEYMRGDYLRVE